jgi:hypothetical protein
MTNGWSPSSDMVCTLKPKHTSAFSTSSPEEAGRKAQVCALLCESVTSVELQHSLTCFSPLLNRDSYRKIGNKLGDVRIHRLGGVAVLPVQLVCTHLTAEGNIASFHACSSLQGCMHGLRDMLSVAQIYHWAHRLPLRSSSVCLP